MASTKGLENGVAGVVAPISAKIMRGVSKGEWLLSRRDSTIVARHEVPGIMRKIAPSQRDD
jgi:hypothetical protein